MNSFENKLLQENIDRMKREKHEILVKRRYKNKKVKDKE